MPLLTPMILIKQSSYQDRETCYITRSKYYIPFYFRSKIVYIRLKAMTIRAVP